MASTKGRGTKRSSSSSSSYTSTITVAIVIAVCVLGVWMLTSNSVVPQQQQPVATTATTTRTSQSATSSDTSKNDPPPFEDNPGDLPEDALKPDDPQHRDQAEPLVKQVLGHEIEEPEEERHNDASGDHQLSEESSLTQRQEAEENIKAVAEEEKPEIHENKEKLEEEDEISKDQNQEQQLQEDEGVQPQQQQQQQQKGNEEENKEEEKNETLPSNETTETDAVTGSKSAEGEGGVGETGAFTGGETAAIPKESKESKKAWSTQADESENQKERRKEVAGGGGGDDGEEAEYGYSWRICNVTAGADYIPCLDNEAAIRKLRSRKHFEHRERHCPEEPPTCLVPIPADYKKPILWPASREKIWYHNVPHTLLAEVKGHQNWVKVAGEFLVFPGGGTQFIHGALHYIDFLQNAVPGIGWGRRTRTVLDVGCGVASFGGFLFERDALAMSFAPKDEHVAQVQFALERGIPAISAVMGSHRLPFPSRVFDVVHCARCRVPWHAEGGLLLLELNRVLRPGGYFVWSATPVYQKLEEDLQIWKEMSTLTESMCWELVTIQKDGLNSIAAAIYRKPDTNKCYEDRKQKEPVMCTTDDDANAAWYVPLQACMHRAPEEEGERGSRWPEEWPRRLQASPFWLNSSQMGIYGRPAPADFVSDSEHWRRAVVKTYLQGLGINWSDVRNVMDMRAVYGGFAAALKGLKVWVMNVVNVDSPDTLPIIYERGLMGIYHDWCESFSTYPRTYDLLHADHLFSRLKKRCRLVPAMAEVDRIVRPGGKLIVRDESGVIEEVVNLLKSLHWEVHLTFSKNKEGVVSAQKYLKLPTSMAAAS